MQIVVATLPAPMDHTIRLIREGYPASPGLDTAISRALLLRVSDGALEETFRIHTPGRIVAFGKRDTLEPGYPDAVAATRAGGFLPVERLAGGRAAVFHEGTLAFSWAIPEPDPRPGIRTRFATLSELMVGAFGRLGIRAAIGEIPGEYCPGEWSVHSGGRRKLMGVGQRLARHGAHIGGVVVVSGAARVNEILEPVYAALDVEWDPTVTGALDDVVPGVTNEEAITAVVAELEARYRVLDARLDAATLAAARPLATDHVATS